MLEGCLQITQNEEPSNLFHEGLGPSSATGSHKWGLDCKPQFLACAISCFKEDKLFQPCKHRGFFFSPLLIQLSWWKSLFQGESSCGVDSSVGTVTGWAELTLRACTRVYCSLPDQLTSLTMHCSKPHCRQIFPFIFCGNLF